MKRNEKSGSTLCAFACDEGMQSAIDKAAGTELISRSAWVRRAVARELARGGFLPGSKPVTGVDHEGDRA